MGQVLFIVWRESVEALLVIGILNAWMNHNPEGRAGRPWLWGGVIAGFLAAVLLAIGLFEASALMSEWQDVFQTVMVLSAAALIVHMVRWMRLHGRTLKRDIESGLAAQAERSNWWGVSLLAGLAVAREGSETVVFLYGTLSAADGSTLLSMAGAAAIGFMLALLTFWLLQLGGKVLNWRLFFRVTEIMLLLLAGALLMSGVDKLIEMGVLPALVDPVWDSSSLLDDSTAAGGLVASLTGYRAHPALTGLLSYALFWLGVWFMMYRESRRS
ncbi:FTR1 family iron permease [Paludibacterium paludis]|uniref:Membrane protein n=1 Tax=Paludibacterium paludis TaxID=1225769 RepID=A0A918UAE3_9NEIS|nr:FTR1 family protein [Paludibacterium paludis]GGY16717.1 membrane protein [Paludibacterium paludis]